jgi:hypothetical protein
VSTIENEYVRCTFFALFYDILLELLQSFCYLFMRWVEEGHDILAFKFTLTLQQEIFDG